MLPLYNMSLQISKTVCMYPISQVAPYYLVWKINKDFEQLILFKLQTDKQDVRTVRNPSHHPSHQLL